MNSNLIEGSTYANNAAYWYTGKLVSGINGLLQVIIAQESDDDDDDGYWHPK